jgi:hypothetical protein
MSELISIVEAAAQGIERLREPQWANPMDHLKIDIIDGKPGPWTHLYSPMNESLNGRDPFDILVVSMDYNAKRYELHTGPLPETEEYRAAVAEFNSVM